MIVRSTTDKNIQYEFDKFAPPVGEGGMGVVYKGEMIDGSNNYKRTVAIKEIRVEGDSAYQESAIDRSRREASIRIKHDNLVEMIDFVEVSDNRFGVDKTKYYVVSEFLNGVSLSDVIVGKCENYEGQIIEFAKEIYDNFIHSREETVFLIIKNVLAAITALHDKGYIHRDIDPSNIMVTDDGKIKLIDFGIAKKLENLQTVSNNLSENGAFVGKVEYAAPELLKGDLAQQGFPTDIYSIGVLFYELLVGRLPFSGSKYEIMQGHQYKKPPLNYIKNKKYKKVIGKALNKYPEMRYASSSEMRVALEEQVKPVNWKLMSAIATLVVIATVAIVYTDWKKKVTERDVVVHPGNKLPDSDTIPDIEMYRTLSLDALWNKLNQDSGDAAALFFISSKSNGMDLTKDSTYRIYYENILASEGYTDKHLIDAKGFSSLRFVYLATCKALEMIENNPCYPKDFYEEVKQLKQSLSSGQTNFK